MKSWIASLCLFLAAASLPSSTMTSIHRMIVGKKGFELQDTRQLTTKVDGTVQEVSISPDGKYVAYVSGEKARQVRIMRISGGRPTILMNVVQEDTATADWAYRPYSIGGEFLAWSPDSKMIALQVMRSVSDDSGAYDQEGIMVFSPSGMKRAVFPLPKSAAVSSHFFWGPDSRRIACTMEVIRKGSDAKVMVLYELFVCDLARGTAKSIFSVEQASVFIQSWSPDGKTLRYTLRNRGSKSISLCEIPAAGGPSVTVQENYEDKGTTSPDGLMMFDAWTGGTLTVEKVGTGEKIKVLDKFSGAPIRWTPDSQFVIYGRRSKIWDETGSRSEQFMSIWLATPAPGKRNHMCAAFYMDDGCMPVFSADSTKMAFTSRGNLHIADLAWTPLTPDEKVEAGMPLTEEETKDVYLRRAKQIGTALNMYQSDWDDRFPSGDNLMELTIPYLRDKDAFFAPGTQNVAFQYVPPSDPSNIANPSETIIGIFDLGYQWQIVLYADGHVKVIPKTK